jgi:hypothetical protein
MRANRAFMHRKIAMLRAARSGPSARKESTPQDDKTHFVHLKEEGFG